MPQGKRMFYCWQGIIYYKKDDYKKIGCQWEILSSEQRCVDPSREKAIRAMKESIEE